MTLPRILACFLLLTACDPDTGDPLRPDAGGMTEDPDGETLYMQPHADGNTFACFTCHALSEPAPDRFVRPGHPIGDAANRPTYKNGQLTSLLDAVNSCRTEWMAADPFREDSPRWVELRGFLETMAGSEPAEPLVYEIVDPPTELEGGDVTAGQDFFNTGCAICHGEGATGTERAPILVNEFLTAPQIARRVRTSGATDSAVYDGLTGGRMPFWAADRISDEQLRDVIAFLLSNDPRDRVMPDAGMPMADVDGGAPREGCPSTHPRVGQTATLINRFHDVEGTATIIDDCTVEVTGFFFDGTGIDVRFYGAPGEDYRNGFNMSDMDLRRATPYANETVRARLPDDRTLDDLDGISVWCVPAGVSFGDGAFR